MLVVVSTCVESSKVLDCEDDNRDVLKLLNGRVQQRVIPLDCAENEADNVEQDQSHCCQRKVQPCGCLAIEEEVQSASRRELRTTRSRVACGRHL